uniref:FEZ-like protein n=1 Tax=Syphacia muris TaxID=451379 RepID=A0A0N5AEH3_9BILA
FFSTNDQENNVDDEFELGNLSGSLEDLVGTFDQKISHCFKDLGEDVEELAPVQVRSQDEIMSESQIWWTLTGNFGNMLPLDFSNSQTRQLQLPALDLQSRKDESESGVDVFEEEELRASLDMHQLISQQIPLSDSPPQTADQVIEEIDQMLQSCEFSGSMMTDRTMESVDSMYSSLRSPLPSGFSEIDMKLRQTSAITSDPQSKSVSFFVAISFFYNSDYASELTGAKFSVLDLQSLSYSKLVTLCAEMEQLIQVYNESLVEQLAHRDELEYEKEMKNTFISLLLSIQNRRRQFANDRKKKALKIEASQLPQVYESTNY